MKKVCLRVFGFMKIDCLSINFAYRAANSKSQCRVMDAVDDAIEDVGIKSIRR